jgi:Txe/YoeB family toxin of Txe-Axe toxin-antitoxin module
MEDKKVTYNFFHWGPFLYKTRLNKEELEKIRSLCSKDNKDVRESLAGLINYEHEIDHKKIFPIIVPYLRSYVQAYTEHHNKPLPAKMELMSSWVNYMTKYESNPIHTHEDDLSFVIFTKIPEKLKEEYDTIVSRSKPGTINFVYKVDDEEMSINTHSFFPTVGDFFIFPAKLNHYVNTFRSDGERVSVSGNLKLSEPERTDLNGKENV